MKDKIPALFTFFSPNSIQDAFAISEEYTKNKSANLPAIYHSGSNLTKDELDNLYFEPDIALYSKDSGQSAIKHIIRNSHGYLRKNGLLLLEHAYNQKDFCQNELKLNNYADIKTYDDLNLLPRVTIGRKI